MIATDETIKIQGELLSYRLFRSKKRKKSLALKINKQGNVQLNVPHKTSVRTIEEFIVSKFVWIQLKLSDRIAKSNIEPLSYNYGSKHFFLGIQYSLQLITAKKSKVELINNQLVVFHRENASIKNLLNKWYKNQALVLFTKRTELFRSQLNFPNVKRIKVRNMKARWGSCSSKAEITYNIHLVKAQPECIDYVVIHELCHLLHPNHGAGFYKLQTKLNPYYKKQKKLLNDSGYKFIQP